MTAKIQGELCQSPHSNVNPSAPSASRSWIAASMQTWWVASEAVLKYQQVIHFSGGWVSAEGLCNLSLWLQIDLANFIVLVTWENWFFFLYFAMGRYLFLKMSTFVLEETCILWLAFTLHTTYQWMGISPSAMLNAFAFVYFSPFKGSMSCFPNLLLF